MAIINTITLIVSRHTSSITTGERVRATLQSGWLIGWIFNTCQLIRSQFHAIRATTNSLKIWYWEAEMAAVSIGICSSVTVVRALKSDREDQCIH